MAYLVLVRHGLSEYNKQGLWTGWDNPELAPEGIEQTRITGESLKDIHFERAYAPDQIRSIETLEEIGKAINQAFYIKQSIQIRERNYGVYTKKNKWQVKKEVGDIEFQKLRRGWDYPIPNGESLKEVYARVIPYFKEEILPQLTNGKNVILVSSGNTLRSLVKYLENISDEKIGSVEIGTGEAYVYQIDEQGKVISKEIRASNPMAGKV